MANPRFRILLVEQEPSRRMNIEKNLAGLGYSRVAPLASMRELLSVIENTSSGFDLLVINEAVLRGAGAAFEHTVRSCPDIKNLLVYKGGNLELLSATHSPVSPMSFSLSCPPDQESIREVMSFVDKVNHRKAHVKNGH